MKHTIGQNVAYYRKKTGMTQEELSEKMGVTAQAVSKWENDLSYPDLECVGRLANILGVSVDELIHGEEAHRSVQVVGTDDPGKRILVISVHVKQEPSTTVLVRIPMALVLQAHADGRLAELIGENAQYVEQWLEVIKQGAVGKIVDVQSADADVLIEVVNYEN